ncbi:MAG: S8 family serine peptidase [Euryarchaeota archaeon]|nr:S8 family serine peptidase [Euryarchaeota archaeon]
MKRSLSTAFIAVVVATGIIAASAAAALVPPAPTRDLVMGYGETGLSQTINVILEHGGRVGKISTATKTLSAAVPITLMDSEIARLTGARFVARETSYALQGAPLTNDPFMVRQWGLQSIHATQAWDVNSDASTIVVAIIDSGVETTHPDIAGNLWTGQSGEHGRNIVGNNSDVTDNCGHGTRVAGVLGAVSNNLEGIAGAAKTSLMIVKTADSATGCSSNSTTLRDGIVWAVDNGARIISMSLGAYVGSDAIVDQALDYAANNSVLMIAAAGNDDREVLYPANSPLVMAVSGLQRAVPEPLPHVADPGLPADILEERWSSSNFGSEVDIAAPADAIYTTLTTADSSMGVFYGYASGTSYAAPFVAGAAALRLAMEPGMTATALKEALESSATDMGPAGWDEEFGHGKLDAAALLASA